MEGTWYDMTPATNKRKVLSSICRGQFESFVRDKILDDPFISSLPYEVIKYRTSDGAINYPKSDNTCELLIEIKNLIAQHHSLAKRDEETGEMDFREAMQAIMKCRPRSKASLWTHRERAAVELAKLYMPNLSAGEASSIETWEEFDVASHTALMAEFRPLAMQVRATPELQEYAWAAPLMHDSGVETTSNFWGNGEAQEVCDALAEECPENGEREEAPRVTSLPPLDN